MSTKHTPGPWHVVGDGPMCSSADGPWNPIQTSRGAMDLTSPMAMKDEHFANARLMAAAPELLDAVKEAYSYFLEGNPSFSELRDEMCDVLRAAIAKTEGR